MKRKIADEMIQSAIRLPRSLHERLKRAGGERGMGEEIRRRLEASVESERAPANPKTRELLDAMSFFAEETTRFYGSWSEDRFAFEVFKACLDMFFMRYQPKGEPVPNPDPDSAADILFAPHHSPQDISRLLVNEWINDRTKLALAHKDKHR